MIDTTYSHDTRTIVATASVSRRLSSGVTHGRCPACICGRVNEQRHVYILVSAVHRNRYYTGLTSTFNHDSRRTIPDSRRTPPMVDRGVSSHRSSLGTRRARRFELYLKVRLWARIRAPVLPLVRTLPYALVDCLRRWAFNTAFSRRRRKRPCPRAVCAASRGV